MDQPLSADRIAEERAFVKRYTDGLASRQVNYGKDFVAPLSERPKRVGVVGIPIADPPELMDVDEPVPTTSKLNLVIKSLKPSLTFNISASPTDPISTLKSLVAASSDSAPPVEAQRLLLKGKALADNKLLKEYDIAEGATIHLVLKPITTPNPMSGPTETPLVAPTPVPAGSTGIVGTTGSTSTTTSNVPPPLEAGASIQHRLGSRSSDSAISPSPSLTRPQGAGHQRVPSLTITTDADLHSRPDSPGSSLLVTDAPPLGPQAQVSSAAFHQTLSDPQFWQKIHALCVAEFVYEDDADAAWEGFLVSMKGRLSAGEAAKIRDVVGVRGHGKVFKAGVYDESRYVKSRMGGFRSNLRERRRPDTT